MVRFIYCPRSGDKVFSEVFSPSIVVVKHHNGCRHVMGGVELSYYAAEPGKHWRGEACQMAAQIIRQTGGIAWDDCGSVTMIVPPEHAEAADQMMVATRQFCGGGGGEGDTRNTIARILQGGGNLSLSLYNAPQAVGYGMYTGAEVRAGVEGEKFAVWVDLFSATNGDRIPQGAAVTPWGPAAELLGPNGYQEITPGQTARLQHSDLRAGGVGGMTIFELELEEAESA